MLAELASSQDDDVAPHPPSLLPGPAAATRKCCPSRIFSTILRFLWLIFRCLKVFIARLRLVPGMASSCCGTKKQKLNNYTNTNGNVTTTMSGGSSSGYSGMHSNHHSHQHHRHQQHGDEQHRGGSSSAMGLTNGHHGQQLNGICRPICNGYGDQEQIAIPDMCFFCFEVLYCELNNIDGPAEPRFTNDP